MLHDPRPRRPRRRGRPSPLLSVTSDTLPTRVDYLCRRVRRATHPGHWLLVVRDGITYGQLAAAYARGNLPAWARARLWAPLGVADPAECWDAYHRTRWWSEDWETNHTAAHLLEDAAGPDLIEPWPHAWLLDPPA